MRHISFDGGNYYHLYNKGSLIIYTYDYDYYKKRMDLYREELMKKVFHPSRLIHYLEI